MNGSNSVPFLDLVTPHRSCEKNYASYSKRRSTQPASSAVRPCRSFETAFAAYSDAKHCVGVGSGTDALRFALIAAGVGAGDIVVTVPNTFIATTEAISQSGAFPVFVDVDEALPDNLDAAKLRSIACSATVRWMPPPERCATPRAASGLRR